MKLAELLKEANNVQICAVPETNKEGNLAWYIYLFNQSDKILHNVIVQSSGEGEIDAWPVKSSVLRHYFEEILPQQPIKVELIMEDVFILTNKYWVSFYINETIYDKQFSFSPNTIKLENCTAIATLNMDGILAQ